MKNLVFAFVLLCSTSLLAQFTYNSNGTGIQSTTSSANGIRSFAAGNYSTAEGNYGSTALGQASNAIGNYSTAIGDGATANGISSGTILENRALPVVVSTISVGFSSF